MPSTPRTSRRETLRETGRSEAAQRLAQLSARTPYVPARPESGGFDGVDAVEAALLRPGDELSPEPGDRPAGDSWTARLADRMPLALRGARWSVSPAAVVGVLVVTVLVAVAVAVRTATAAPGVPVPARPAAVAGAASAAAGSPTPAGAAAPTPAASPAPGGPSVAGAAEAVVRTPGSAGQVVVHVVGQVAEPGLVRLAVGARVDDALTAAGGATDEADLGQVNLARLVVDGEQVFVPRPGEVPPGGGAGASVTAPAGPSPAGAGAAAGAPAGSPLDLNAATLADLDGLPGIGPVLAQRILDWREQNGRFTSVEELGEVSGIGDRVLENLRPLVRV